jgi:glutamate synthase domain-containing protein 1/glutamate synthase domain-containing protein 3
MISRKRVETILKSRQVFQLQSRAGWHAARDEAAEGGCGVIGIACSEQIPGRHLLQALGQMRNRGNGKGGGIAAVGLVPEELGVTWQVLENDYLLAVAYLDPTCRREVEDKHIHSTFDVDHVRQAPHLDDYHQLERLEVRPPEVVQYFVRVKPEVYAAFNARNGTDLSRRKIEDEIVYQNTFRLNSEFYAATGETRAFVLSHGKNLMVLKMVGYGDDVVRFYQLEDLHAHVWIGHHRYPTKGHVWHPGGAHPFVGLNEALVHNGDFANYASIVEYLAQRNIYPLFLTDTEVSALTFDLLYRTYGYPLEYVIEALAPTTERDFTMLPSEKQRIYEMLQVTHIHCSPDGPWFFLIAQSDQEESRPVYRLTGITDTSMLRPQVFALQQASYDAPGIGFAASEKQAIDAALASLAGEDTRFWARADRFWNARGGSHTDGGAFIFSVYPNGNGSARLICTDKFKRRISINSRQRPYQPIENGHLPTPSDVSEMFWSPNPGGRAMRSALGRIITHQVGQPIVGLAQGFRSADAKQVAIPNLPAPELFLWVKDRLPGWTYDDFSAFLLGLEETIHRDGDWQMGFEVLTLLMDRRYPAGELRRSSLLALIDQSLARLGDGTRDAPRAGYVLSSADQPYCDPAKPDQKVVIDGRGYEREGDHSLALEIVRLYQNGFRRFMVTHTRGHRFIGNGFGPRTQGVRIDVYGSPGDYLASGIDGMEIYVHGDAQDQLAQIMKSGKLVVYGHVGQTFGYAAKGGQVYILGNAAGRPMINAVGRPRVVINGTCLDYLAESFMAGDPHDNGGFVIVNGIHLTDEGNILELETPYPGGNLFSLASGGAIFIRDPHWRVTSDQLNGGEFFPFEPRDWVLIRPYLQENARLFDIPVEGLLTVDGQMRRPEEVYRKIAPVAVRALQAEEAWVHKK